MPPHQSAEALNRILVGRDMRCVVQNQTMRLVPGPARRSHFRETALDGEIRRRSRRTGSRGSIRKHPSCRCRAPACYICWRVFKVDTVCLPCEAPRTDTSSRPVPRVPCSVGARGPERKSHRIKRVRPFPWSEPLTGNAYYNRHPGWALCRRRRVTQRPDEKTLVSFWAATYHASSLH